MKHVGAALSVYLAEDTLVQFSKILQTINAGHN